MWRLSLCCSSEAELLYREEQHVLATCEIGTQTMGGGLVLLGLRYCVNDFVLCGWSVGSGITFKQMKFLSMSHFKLCGLVFILEIKCRQQIY